MRRNPASCRSRAWWATIACSSKPQHGRLLVRPAEAIAGLIEVRGLGIRRLAYEPVAVVGLVVDLAVADAERLPAAADQEVDHCRHRACRDLRSQPSDAVPAVLALLRTVRA